MRQRIPESCGVRSRVTGHLRKSVKVVSEYEASSADWVPPRIQQFLYVIRGSQLHIESPCADILHHALLPAWDTRPPYLQSQLGYRYRLCTL